MKALALQYQHKTSNKENVSASLVYISKTRQTWCGVLLPALTARSISILFAAKISSFLSVSRSARWQMISLLWQVNKIIQFFSLSDKAPKELFTFLNVYKRYCPSPLSKNMCHLVWMQRCKGSSRTARHFCLFLHRWAWRRVRTELNIRACRCSFTAIKIFYSAQVNSPAGLNSEKKVPTFLPSTMSVMTWPVTLGLVPFAITTEVPPCKAQRAALTCSQAEI